MRNLFDQYSQPENRLSHALAVCLNEDRILLRGFLRWIGASTKPDSKKLKVIEQSVPGDEIANELEAERRGLPDIIIHDDDSWCVLIESKINAPLTADQLTRHRRTLERRGFTNITVLALTKSDAPAPLGVSKSTWSDIYEWLGRTSSPTKWGERLRDYLRIAESRFAEEGYLVEGTLTRFDGFRFADDRFSYGEAKRLLKLAMGELRQQPRLLDLGIDPDARGRGAITQSTDVVWDVIPLKSEHSDFTKYPHLTFDVTGSLVRTAITIPNGVEKEVRKRLAALAPADYVEINQEVLARAKPLIENGAKFRALVLQRHYLGRRGEGIRDGVAEFRLETSQQHADSKVKHQPEWWEFFASLTKQPKSNLQFSYRAALPLSMNGMDSRESLDLIVQSWIAMEPLLRRLRSD